MTELIVTRGLPGSGKSYWAKAWVAADMKNRARVERDQLRKMMHDGAWLGRATEEQIVWAQHAMIRALLTSGVSVVVSDTNLHPGVFNELRALAGDTPGVEFKVQDFTEVDLNLCLTRNRQRPGAERIPEDAILGMYNRYIK